MIKPRAKLLPANPRAIVQTSTGWRYPDGTVKPFYKQQVPSEPVQEQKPALVNRAKQVVSALTGFGRG